MCENVGGTVLHSEGEHRADLIPGDVEVSDLNEHYCLALISVSAHVDLTKCRWITDIEKWIDGSINLPVRLPILTSLQVFYFRAIVESCIASPPD